MKLAFIDIIYGYDAARPDADEPLGGTTSALCFLARALRAQGHEIHIFNTIEQPSNAHDIPALPLSYVMGAAVDPSYDAFIFCGRWIPEMVEAMRAQSTAPFIAWMHENLFDDKFVRALPAFDGALYVSEWQCGQNLKAEQPHWRCAILRNAMNPLYARMWGEGQDPAASKGLPPRLLFAGDFARGAFHLGRLIELLDPMPEPWEIEIFCDEQAKPAVPANIAYMAMLKSHRRVRHLGKVGQPRLAAQMKEASILCAPNTWPETSCIVLIEALAAGLDCVTTNRAALPETASGYATLVEIPDANDPRRLDMPFPYEAFAQVLRDRILAHCAGEATNKTAQRDFFLAHYQWPDRARQLADYIGGFKPVKLSTEHVETF